MLSEVYLSPIMVDESEAILKGWGKRACYIQCTYFIRQKAHHPYSVGRPEDTVSQNDKKCSGQRGTSIAEKLLVAVL